MIDEVSQPTTAQHSRCFPNKHLTVDEHGFYSVCFAMAHTSKGRIDFASRRFAKLFAGNAEGGRMGKSKAAELANQLESKGWFLVLKPSVKDPETGQRTPTTYRVLSHDEWAQKHTNECRRIADALPPDSGLSVGNVPSPRLRTGDDGEGEGVAPMASIARNHLWNQQMYWSPVRKCGQAPQPLSTGADRRNDLNLGKPHHCQSALTDRPVHTHGLLVKTTMLILF